jgi:hypothetical protein
MYAKSLYSEALLKQAAEVLGKASKSYQQRVLAAYADKAYIKDLEV